MSIYPTHHTARPTEQRAELQPMAREDRRFPHSRVMSREAYRAWLQREGRP